MLKQTKRSIPALLAALLFALHLALPTIGAAQAGRIAFLPFKANAPQDMSYLTSGIRDMLASRLASEVGLTVIDKTAVDKALAAAGTPTQNEAFIKLGKSLQADFLVVGSLTAMGSSLSLDAKVFEMAKGAPRNFYATAKNESEIIQSIDSLAWDISEKIFSHQRPATALVQPQTAVQQSAQPQPQYATAHPERAFASRTGMGGGSPFIYPKGITSEFQKTQNMKLSLQFMEMADLDGDGQDEVIFADIDSVQIFKRDNTRLSKVGQIPGKVGYRVHAITVADLNKNGKPEIYVSAANHNTPNSFAFEWLGADKATYLFQEQQWYVRAMPVPGEGMVLAGQRAELDKAVAPGIFRLNLSNGVLKASSSMEVPAGVNLFEFTIADLDNDGSREIIAIDQYDRLQVLRAGGTALWKSDEFYGGTTRFIGGEAATSAHEPINNDKNERVYIPSRIIVYDVNGDGQQDIILNKNLSTSSRIFKNMKNYPSGEIHALTWNGLALSELWRTRKIDGYIVDYLLRPNADKKGAELLVGLILSSSSLDLFSEQTSTMLIYQLDFSKKQEQ
ncbi:MAG: VCBS repeat-containing protein [Proteobacteria bacterium]|nr:VCBS repeat-containing protein [Pseudomonadota bacterium]MBU1545317.1 VCBS repeat-containing protein [Pseudomonadota bacterium]MBU2619632.1 VCBS repeat-containing protein [Pseudomonadota bacterium]